MPKTARIEGKENDLLVIKCVHEMQLIHTMELLAASFKCENDTKGFHLDGVKIAPVESAALFQFLNHVENLNVLQMFNCTMENFVIRVNWLSYC